MTSPNGDSFWFVFMVCVCLLLNEAKSQEPRGTACGVPAVRLNCLAADGRANGVANGGFDFIHVRRDKRGCDADKKRAVASGVKMTEPGIAGNEAHRQTGGQGGTVF